MGGNIGKSMEKIDLRTDRERVYDEEVALIVARYRELIPYAPTPTRAMNRIAEEMGIQPGTVRYRLKAAGVYVPGTRPGNRNGNIPVAR